MQPCTRSQIDTFAVERPKSRTRTSLISISVISIITIYIYLRRTLNSLFSPHPQDEFMVSVDRPISHPVGALYVGIADWIMIINTPARRRLMKNKSPSLLVFSRNATRCFVCTHPFSSCLPRTPSLEWCVVTCYTTHVLLCLVYSYIWVSL